jgi:radical SAM superfamily enzyme YgiQ (UPF0313 family)
MKIALIFTPYSSPAYIPIGPAALAAYVRMRVPRAEITIHDFNLSAWHDLARKFPENEGFWEFMHGERESFFEENDYRQYLPLFGKVKHALMEFKKTARNYLETGELPDELGQLLAPMIDRLLSDPPQILAFSVIYLDQLPFALALARRCIELNSKNHSPAFRVILGGAAMHAFNLRELFQAFPFVDWICQGEGEEAFARLAEGGDPDKIPGIRTRSSIENETVLPNPPLLLNCLPFPDFGDYPLEKYANPTPVLPVAFSRDCRWRKCRFCVHNFTFSGYREKPVARFVDELEWNIARFNARHFYIVDQYMPAKSLEAVSEEILRRGLSVFFHVMGRPSREFTRERLEKMAAAGCCWISWGVESGSQRLLDLCRKGTRRETIIRVIKNAHAVGITNLPMLIFGLPTSQDKDLQDTFQLLEDIYSDVDDFTTSSFVLYQGTEFARNPSKYGLSIIGTEVLFDMEETRVHSTRLDFMRMDADGKASMPAGPQEIAQWIAHRRWLGDASFKENLCCEHYLIYCAAQMSAKRTQPIPTRPRKAA